MQKPVWRMNTGVGVPSDADGTVFRPDINPNIVGRTIYLYRDCLWSENGRLTITHYQTTRTKAAKYRRVNCDWCADERELTGISNNNACRACKGSGSYREKI